MRRLLIYTLLTGLVPQIPAATVAPATQFSAHVDGYQVIPGYSTKTSADFKMTLEANGNLHFALTPQNTTSTVTQVALFRGQFFAAPDNALYNLCGQGSYSPRPSCAQSYYGQSYSSGELVPSDLLPYGSYSDTSNLVDLLRHNLVFIVVQFSDGTQIRGQLAPG